MKIHHFEVVSGLYIKEIPGQSRIGYSMSDTTEFYDMAEWLKRGGYRGSILSFYDYGSAKVYQPFPLRRNVLYGDPVYLKGYFWFLQGDYNSGKMTLFKYLPDEIPEMVTQLNIADINPYNLRILGEDVSITSLDDAFVCYYPVRFRFSINPNESVCLISDGKVYCSAWVEEGWDDESDFPTEKYEYYEKVIVRDFQGTVLSETRGSLQQHSDGTWWIS